MIRRQHTMMAPFCLIRLGLALPFPPSHQANHSTSTLTSQLSASRIQAASTAASSTNPTSSHLSAAIKSITANHTVPSQATYSALSQPQWSPGDISTIVFGCIASILGVLALYMTLWLGRRGPGSFARRDFETGSRLFEIGASPGDPDLPLENLDRNTDGEVAATERRERVWETPMEVQEGR